MLTQAKICRFIDDWHNPYRTITLNAIALYWYTAKSAENAKEESHQSESQFRNCRILILVPGRIRWRGRESQLHSLLLTGFADMLYTSHMVPAYHSILYFTPVTWSLLITKSYALHQSHSPCISQYHMLQTSHMVPAYHKIIYFRPVTWSLHITKSYTSHQSYGSCI
jgi:hypothetical protein